MCSGFRIGEFNEEIESFEQYEERLQEYFTASEVDNAKQRAVLLTVIGSKNYTLVKNLITPKKPSECTYAQIVAELKKHFCPKRNVTIERFKFYSRNQKKNEKIMEYIICLRALADTCAFNTFREEALRDRVVSGIANLNIQRRLLAEDDLTLDKAIKISQAMETAERQSKEIHEEDEASEVHKVYKRYPQKYRDNKDRNFSKKREENRKSQCERCGKAPHARQQCPAKDWTCFKCKKKGHSARMCRTRVHKVEGSPSSQSEAEDDEQISNFFSINNVIGNSNKPVISTIVVNGVQLKMEVDTGASISLIPELMYNDKFSKIKLEKSHINLRNVSGQKIEVLGKCELPVKLINSSLEKKLPIYVIKSNFLNCTPLLGRSWLDQLQPNWRDNFEVKSAKSFVNLRDNEFQKNNLLNKFSKVFDVNNHEPIKKFKASLNLKDNVIPVYCRSYPVAYAVQQAVEDEIKDLVKRKILEPVEHSEWASPVVAVMKKNNKVRLCGDYKISLNKNLNTNIYPLPHPNDVFAKLSKSKCFTVLDLTNAYLQMELEEKSQALTTVNTHLGLYKFKRLPYGISSAPAIFQSMMDHVLKDIPMTSCYLDDILIGGEDEEDCYNNVEAVLERLETHNIRVKVDKCQWFQKSVEYLGHEISCAGLKPLKGKTEQIQSIKPPNNVTQLKSYLGLLNYYRKFLPMLSSELKPLHRLLETKVKFDWTEECQKAFERSKEMLQNSKALIFFNPDYPTSVTCDASPFGVGAVLNHIVNGEERPVMFESCSLSKTEQGYAHIQREALAIIFAIKKFHKYLFGRKFEIVTDHQPIKLLLGKDKRIPTLAAARIQRWALTLAAYDYTIKYRKGSEIGNADALSRIPSEKILNEDANYFSEIEIPPLSTEQIASETRKDGILSKVLDITRRGWSDYNQQSSLQPYFNRRRELSVEEGVLVWNNRVIIPSALRNQVLELLHDQHPGIVRTKMLSRGYVWWPCLDQDIEQKTSRCSLCQENQNLPKPVTTAWPRYTKPWVRLHADFFHFKENSFLIIIDSTSKWTDVYRMQGTNLNQTLNKFRQSFAIFGIPEQLVTDNGPPFNSEGFQTFCKSNGIILTHSPAYHAPSNGQAERAVQTIKRLLKKNICESNDDLSVDHRLAKLLFAYRNTPSTVTGRSPAEILCKFQPRTLLGILKPNIGSTTKSPEVTPNHIRNFYKNDKVFVKKLLPNNRYLWEKGTIEKRIGKMSYIVTLNGKSRTVHVNHLRKRGLEEKLLSEIQIQNPTDNNEEKSLLEPNPSSPSKIISPEVSKSDSPLSLRRSTRIRKPVARFNP